MLRSFSFVSWIGPEAFQRNFRDYSERLKMAMDDDKRPDLGLREQTEKVFEEAKELRRMMDKIRHLRRSAPD